MHTSLKLGLLLPFALVACAGAADPSSGQIDSDDPAVHLDKVDLGPRPTLVPDLIPVWTTSGYCGPGELTVQVKNQGTASTGVPSTTWVKIGTMTYELYTPILLPGETSSATGNFFTPDGRFTITVNATNDVPELNEANDVAVGACLE
jgi:hypothetical protein